MKTRMSTQTLCAMLLIQHIYIFLTAMFCRFERMVNITFERTSCARLTKCVAGRNEFTGAKSAVGHVLSYLADLKVFRLTNEMSG